MSNQKIFGNLFLGIGAMKAGTTWLYAVLDRHPQLHFTPEKELHYFYHRYVDSALLSEPRRLQNARERYIFRFDPAKANIDRIRQNLHWVSAYLDTPVDNFWYRNLFQLRHAQMYACDFSNLNAHLPAQAWPQIAAQCETLRVLYTMRDPVRRLWSHAKFHLEVTGQTENLRNWGPGEFDRFVRQPHIWNNAEYGRVLRNLRAGLPPDSWKAIFYEDLHRDQTGTLRDIEGFLGVKHHSYPPQVLARRFTESIKLEMPDYFEDMFAPDVARIKHEVEEAGFSLPQGWSRPAGVETRCSG